MDLQIPDGLLPLDQTMIGYLGIELLEQTPDRLLGRMPIDHRTVQPMNVAHGSALICLAETLASMGTILSIDWNTQFCVGQEINASLLRPVQAGGSVEGEAVVVHRGRTTMIWDVRIRTLQGKLAAICRCTIAIRSRGDTPGA